MESIYIKMKTLSYFALIVSFSLANCWAGILAYWDFGPDADNYTEAVTIENVSGTPTFSLVVNSPSLKDDNGKNGTAYTDPDGTLHIEGQAAAIQDAYDNAATLQIALDGTGFQLTEWRWDSYTDDSGGSVGPRLFDVSFSTNGGVSWISIAANVYFQRAGEKDEYYSYSYDLSLYSELSSSAAVVLRLNYFQDGTGGSCAFDNMLVAGHAVGAPELTLNPLTTVYYVRPGDEISLTASATEPDGHLVSLTASNLPAGAIFTNKVRTAPLSSDFYWEPETPGLYTIDFTAADADGFDTKSIEVYVMRERCALMLNEANAVGSSTNLDVPDAAFLKTTGNGGNWVELMVVEDHLDIRGWELQWAETGDASSIAQDYWYGNASILQGIITFSQDTALSDLRKGTILTIIENAVALTAGGTAVTDLSVTPTTGDWWMNICSTQEVAWGNRYLSTQSNNSTNQGDFSVGASDWQMRILDDSGIMVAPPVGEGINGCEASVSKTEVLALKDTFDASMCTAEDYTDRDYSSFGLLNIVDDETSERQDARWLRAWAYFSNTAQLVINEYNCVGDGTYLGGIGTDDEDAMLGRVAGNGGSWVELVVTEDHLDVRGWSLAWQESGGTTTGLLTFGQSNVWSDLRQGTVITIAQNMDMIDAETNVVIAGSALGYAPESGDFWIHVSVLCEATQLVPAVEGTFATESQGWEGTLYNAGGAACFGPVGEDYLEVSVSSTECMRVWGALTNVTLDLYDDAKNSTFGSPNPLPGSGDQDWEALRAVVPSPPLLLNEYNTVRNGDYLRDDGTDTRFGRIEGNGGNWLEFVVTEDHLDLRKWRIQWAEQEDLSGEGVIWLPNGDIKQGELVLSDSDWLTDFRRGAVLTFIETAGPGDLAATAVLFDPINTNWWMNICTMEEAATTNPLVSTVINVSSKPAGTFSIGHENWIVRVLDATGGVQFATFGEDYVPAMNVSYDEIARREADNETSDWMNWDDGNDSSFGQANLWGSTTQDLSSLRSWYPGSEPSDQDDDGMPDTWELDELGTTGARPQVDVDGDEFSNLQEYLVLTDPDDPDSYFRVDRPGTEVACSFFAASGRVYQLEGTVDLDAPWSVLESGLVATNEILVIPLPEDGTATFFRVNAEMADE